MTCPVALPPLPVQRRSHLHRLSPRASFFLLASITLSFLAGSSAPTPLYAIYQARWGFSATLLTVAFGVYAIAVLASLLVAGRLSDHIGRRPVLMAAIAAQIIAMAAFGSAGDVGDLLLGRVIQGLSAGAALAAVGAGLLDLDRTRGMLANAVAPMMGTALGGVVAGLMVQYLPAPLHLVYGVLGVVYLAQGVGVSFMAETAAPRVGAWASLRPQFSLPPALRGPVWRAVPALVAVWSTAGFYASLGPTLIHRQFGTGSAVAGGFALFVLAASGAAAVWVLRKYRADTLTRFGGGALLVGIGVVLLSLPLQAMAVFLVGTAVAGLGFGAGFQGALRSVVPLAAPDERAGVLSVVFVVSYLSMGLPAILAGWGLAKSGDIESTASAFGAVVIVLALLALVFKNRPNPDAGG